jgi:hypothetical protein
MESTTNKLSSPRQWSTGNLWAARIALLLFIPMLVACLATPASAAWEGYFAGSVPYAIVAAGTTQVWALDTSGNIYQYNSSTNKFDSIPGNLVQIAVGTGNTVWGLDLSGDIHQYDFKTKKFQKVTGKLRTIAAGGQGIWGVNASDVTYVWDSVTKSFQKPLHGGPSNARSIFVGSYEIGVWVLDGTLSGGNAWLYNTNNDYFDETNGVLYQIAVGNDEVWGVASDNTVWEYDVTTEKWIKPDPSALLVQMAAGTDSNIWGVDILGAVYNYDQTTKEFVNQNAKSKGGSILIIQQISVSAGTAGVWGVDIDGTIWKK